MSEKQNTGKLVEKTTVSTPIKVDTVADNSDGKWIDKYGVIYSKDRKRLLQSNPDLTEYQILEETTIICDYAFEYSKLKNISIPVTVTHIGNRAFQNCKLLESIQLPESVKFIGDSAFSSCYSLTHLFIPDSVKEIGESAFYNCNSIKRITLSNSIKHIKKHTFGQCESIKEIIIPRSVTSIDDWAFFECSSLKNVVIYGSIENIGVGAFSWCPITKADKEMLRALSKNDIFNQGTFIDLE